MQLWAGACRRGMSGTSLLLMIIALAAGVGITAVGPGGVFLTAALFVGTDLSSAAVAGTASATFVATGLVGSGAYVRSGELATRPAWASAAWLSATGLVGALVGARINLAIGAEGFGRLLGAFLVGGAGLIMYREWTNEEAPGVLAGSVLPGKGTRRRGILAAVGGVVGLLGGLLGVGGPVVAVPMLVSLGMPIRQAVAVAQVQSVVLALVATARYAAAGAVDPALALLVGVPQLVGVGVGWRVAHRVAPGRLRKGLAGVLVVVGAGVAL